jgi:hypothetical protein
MRPYFIVLIILLPLVGNAQYRIDGFIQKPGGSSIGSITIVLNKHGEPGVTRTVVADSTGNFTFSVSGPGIYQLRPISILYRDTMILVSVLTDQKRITLGNIQLQPFSKTLAAVTITAKKETIEFKEDHIVFNPGADRSIGSMPVADVLNRIPGITVDAKNNITARGQEGIQLLVNGKLIRMGAGDYLAQLSADEVDRIEVFENATRFSYLKSPVIINVILKSRPNQKLWNAAITSNTLPRINPSLDASFSFGKQRIYARLSHDVSNFNSRGNLSRWTDSFRVFQEFDSKVRHSMTTSRVGWDYSMDSLSILSVEGNFSRHNDRSVVGINVNIPSDNFQNRILSSPVEKELAGFITYKKDRRQRGHLLFEIGLTGFSLRNDRNLPGLVFTEERNMHNSSIGFKAEWQKTRKGTRMVNGISGQRTRITDRIDTLPGLQYRQTKFFTNSITTYHEFGWQQKKWNLSVGANFDYVEMDLNTGGKRSFNYQNIFANPSLRMQYSNGKYRATFSYNRKYILPGTHLLFGQYSQYEFGRTAPGNYVLRPAVQDLLKLSFTATNKATLLLELYYDLTRNPAMMLYHADGLYITEKPENLKSRKSVGAVISISCTVRPFYSFTLNMDGRMNDHEFNEKTFVLNQRTFSGSSTLINRFNLSKKLSFSLNAAMHNWRTTLYRDMKSIFIYSLQGNYKMNQRMNLSFSVNDLMNNMQFKYSGMIVPGYFENGLTRSRMRNVSLSARYQLINSQLDKKTTTVKSFLSE